MLYETYPFLRLPSIDFTEEYFSENDLDMSRSRDFGLHGLRNNFYMNGNETLDPVLKNKFNASLYKSNVNAKIAYWKTIDKMIDSYVIDNYDLLKPCVLVRTIKKRLNDEYPTVDSLKKARQVLGIPEFILYGKRTNEFDKKLNEIVPCLKNVKKRKLDLEMTNLELAEEYNTKRPYKIFKLF